MAVFGTAARGATYHLNHVSPIGIRRLRATNGAIAESLRGYDEKDGLWFASGNIASGGRPTFACRSSSLRSTTINAASSPRSAALTPVCRRYGRLGHARPIRGAPWEPNRVRARTAAIDLRFVEHQACGLFFKLRGNFRRSRRFGLSAALMVVSAFWKPSAKPDQLHIHLLAWLRRKSVAKVITVCSDRTHSLFRLQRRGGIDRRGFSDWTKARKKAD